MHIRRLSRSTQKVVAEARKSQWVIVEYTRTQPGKALDVINPL